MKKFLKSGGSKRHDSSDDPSSPDGDDFMDGDGAGCEDEETYEEVQGLYVCLFVCVCHSEICNCW